MAESGMKSKRLELRIMSAQKLIPMHSGKSLPDPYVKPYLMRHGQRILVVPTATFICYNTVEPQWYETFQLGNVHHDDELFIEIWNHCPHSTHCIAHVTVPIKGALDYSTSVLRPHLHAGSRVKVNAKLQRKLTRWYSLTGSPVKLALLIVDSSVVEPLAAIAPGNRYVQFVARKARPPGQAMAAFAGVVAGIGKHLHLELPHHVHMKEHATYSIRMDFIAAIFGNVRQHWNRDYVAARRIFKGALAAPMQLALRNQHHYLYNSYTSPIANLRKEVSQSTGALLDADDFTRLLECGVRNGKRRVYTYVVVDDELRFCETGASIHKDMESKHAMHACAAEEVVYAGEFHFRPGILRGEPRIRLVVDNNSGTYAPEAKKLYKMRHLFERNFEGLEVQTLDFKDPLLKEYALQLHR